MQLVLETPHFFFYDLITKSKKKYSIITDDITDAYLVNLLSALAIGEPRFNAADPLSLLYLQACQTDNKSLYQLVGDSSLLFLGFFPSAAPKASQALYRNIGISSYDAFFLRLAQQFDQAVRLLLGAQLMLEGDNVLPFYPNRSSLS